MKRIATLAAQWILALVFAVAAGLKLAWMAGQGHGGVGGAGPAGGGAEAQTIFGALPVWSQWALVVLELALAVWLAGGWRQRAGAFVTLVVLSAFLAAILLEMERPAPRSCGCMGALAPQQPWFSLWMSLGLDCALIALALWVYFAASNPATRLLTSGAPGD